MNFNIYSDDPYSPNMRRVLIIGGYHDGQRVEVDVNMRVIRLAERPSLAEVMRWPPTQIVVEMRVHNYHQYKLYNGDADNVRYIYHDPSIPRHLVMDYLIDGYTRK